VNDLLEVIYVELLTKFRSFHRKTAIQICGNFEKYDSVRVFSIIFALISGLVWWVRFKMTALLKMTTKI
jgi:hypothetical protein